MDIENFYKTHRKTITSFTFLIGVMGIVFCLWQIDVSVGAIHTGGVIYQDGVPIDPLKYYEMWLSKLWFTIIVFVFYTGYFLTKYLDYK